MRDAWASVGCAIASLWPDVPYQICQIPAFGDPSRAIFEEDRTITRAVREKLQPTLRLSRSNVVRRTLNASVAEKLPFDVL
ncbi:MAG TPA: hypothetical protein VGF67_02795 [Ktedonobacteraceae bacterium]